MTTRSSALGFTLIELITVIILLSVLSLYAASRYIGTGSFSAYALQEQAIAVIRQIQVNRMQSNVSTLNDNFRLQVTTNCLGSVQACSLSGSARDARSDIVTDPKATFTLQGAVTSPVNFDLRGNPLASASAGVSVLIQDKSGQSQCVVEINTQGYVSKGACS
ncbi:type II secretion system protein [Vibrio sp. CAU 1672]|uniref:type II secretion system protein n=1 Tax=Vibrio sp. CAU 1672 TaxID=3032594 RepID=UPI0023DB8139|nr:type II secretion system protein [Vibrio sp. CAU 1672]MDF2155631.1 type II secretion system protein [Vibrio sp. CAU 1672]